MKTMGAAKFKERCLSVLDNLDQDGLVITKHGRPVARVTPYERGSSELIGCMEGRLRILGDVMTPGLEWDADAQP